MSYRNMTACVGSGGFLLLTPLSLTPMGEDGVVRTEDVSEGVNCATHELAALWCKLSARLRSSSPYRISAGLLCRLDRECSLCGGWCILVWGYVLWGRGRR